LPRLAGGGGSRRGEAPPNFIGLDADDAADPDVRELAALDERIDRCSADPQLFGHLRDGQKRLA
jgi:hypothetical protein